MQIELNNITIEPKCKATVGNGAGVFHQTMANVFALAQASSTTATDARWIDSAGPLGASILSSGFVMVSLLLPSSYRSVHAACSFAKSAQA